MSKLRTQGTVAQVQEENIVNPPTDLASWIEYLSAKPLALLDSTVIFVDQLHSGNGKSIDNICNQMLLDPGVVATLVCRANSQNKTRLSTEVTTLENAVKLLGIDNSRGILKRLKVLKLPVKSTNLRNYLQTVVRAYHAGYQAYKWATLRGDSIAKESYIAALMFHIGEMMMWLYAAAEMHKIQQWSESKGVCLQQAQVDVLGFTVNSLSAGINHKWNLPELVRDCFDGDNIENKRVKNVLLSVKLAQLAEQGWYTHAMRDCELAIAQLCQRDVADVMQINHQVAVAAARDSCHLGMLTAAEGLLNTAVECAVCLDNISPIQTDQQKAVRSTGPRQEDVETPLKPVSSDSQLDGAMRKIKTEAGYSRVVFCEFERATKQCKAVRFVDMATQQQLSRLYIDLSRSNLFTRMFEKSQSLFINAANQSKYWPLIPIVVKGTINVKCFVVMSVRVPGKLEGFIYADGAELDEGQYQHFKKICKELLVFLEA